MASPRAGRHLHAASTTARHHATSDTSLLRALLARLLPDRHPEPAANPPAGPDALVQVYRRAGHLHVEASNRTRWAEAGFWVASGEVTTLDEHVDDTTLGGAVLDAVARSRVEVPVPPRDATLEAGLFRAMGVRSRRSAMSGTCACLVSREKEPIPSLRIEALHNGGTRGDGRGYRALPGQPAPVDAVTIIPLDVVAPTTLGAAVRRALQVATLVS